MQNSEKWRPSSALRSEGIEGSRGHVAAGWTMSEPISREEEKRPRPGRGSASNRSRMEMYRDNTGRTDTEIWLCTFQIHFYRIYFCANKKIIAHI